MGPYPPADIFSWFGQTSSRSLVLVFEYPQGHLALKTEIYFSKMFMFPQASEELPQATQDLGQANADFFEELLEAYEEQDITPSVFQPGPCFPQPAENMIPNRDLMMTPEGYQPFNGHQGTNHEDQMSHYGQMSLYSSNSQGSIQSVEHYPSWYETSAYRGIQYPCMAPQMTIPAASQPLYDSEMQTPRFYMPQLRSMQTTFNAEDNLSQYQETTARVEVPPYMGPIQTAYVDENVCSSQKPSPNVEGSHSSQRTSFGNQTPYEDVSMDSSGSFVSQSHALQSFSVSTSDQAQPPRQKSDMEAHHSVAQKKFFCPYQDCEKSYTRSYHLKDHLKKHRGEKPFVCNQPGCQWRFFRSEDLRRHQSKHSGMRQYPCAKCNKNFSRLSYLKQHQRICTQAGPSARN